MGRWTLSVEGANTYSPDPARKAARARMERAVYRQRGVLIATDYLVNAGGVIFAAQEQLIPTPEALHLPADKRGDRSAVERWLAEHAEAFTVLAEQRRQAAEAWREAVIRRNMGELIAGGGARRSAGDDQRRHSGPALAATPAPIASDVAGLVPRRRRFPHPTAPW